MENHSGDEKSFFFRNIRHVLDFLPPIFFAVKIKTESCHASPSFYLSYSEISIKIFKKYHIFYAKLCTKVNTMLRNAKL